MDDARRNRRKFGHADAIHIFFEEFRAARDVLQGVFRAVLVPGVVDLAQVANVVEQRCDDAEAEQPGTKLTTAILRTLVAVH